MIRAALYTSAAGLDVAKELVLARFDALRDLAAARGWIVVVELADLVVDSWSTRKGYADLRRRVETGQVDVVVSESLSRLFRHILVGGRDLPEWTRRGVRVVTLDGTDGMSELGWPRLLAFAEVLGAWRADFAAERAQMMERRAAARGPRPKVTGPPRLALNPYEIRMAWERGYSRSEALTWLRRRGCPVTRWGYVSLISRLRDMGELDSAKREAAIAARGGLPKGGRPKGSKTRRRHKPKRRRA